MKKLIASIAVLAAMAIAVPVMASDVPGHSLVVGGRVKVDMGWQILPEESTRNNSDSTIANFFMTVNQNSYFRAIFTSADKTTGAHIEFGVGSAINRNNSTDNGADNWAGLRMAFGWWKVGSCKLLVGQYASTLGAIYYPNSNLGHTKSFKSNLNGFGFIGGGTRNPKVGLQMAINDNFSFDVAIGQAGAESSNGNFGVGTRGAQNSYLPRLEVVLNFQFGNFSINPGGGISYQSWKYDETGGQVDNDDNALSFLLWLPMQYKTGPFTIMLSAYYGQNMDTDWTGEWGMMNDWGNGPVRGGRALYQFGGQPGALPAFANGEIEDTQSWGVGLAMDYAFTDQLSISLGGGMNNSKNDAWATAANDRDDYTRWGAYVSMPYKVTSNFTIAPEVAYYNYGKWVGVANANADEKAKDEWLLGIHFQFLF